MARSLKARLGALEQSTRQPTQPFTDTETSNRQTSKPADIACSSSLLDASVEKLAHPAPSAEGLQSLGFFYEDEGNGGFWHRRLSYDLLSYYGNVRYQAILSRDLALLARACKHSAASKLSVENLRFYDTETTGLGTGAGTFPFLHAVGQIEEDEWVIHQYFIDDFREEPALLDAMTRRHFHEGVICVNFNGKVFDWPLFQNRLIMYQIELGCDIPQLDLLHPSRRLWRKKLGKVSLGHLEEVVMGITRLDDLPGREAPARYFSYITDKDVERVRPVLNHNAADVSALLGLAVVLADMLNGETVAESAGEYSALGKWYDEWQEYDLAEQCWISAVNCPDATWREFWLTSLRYKRLRQWDEANRLWEEMAQRYPWSTAPLVELAKYCEHHQRDYTAAVHWTQSAIHRVLVAGQSSNNLDSNIGANFDRTLMTALRHRLQRIQRKATSR